MNFSVGIDFGTSTTEIARAEGGNVTLLESGAGVAVLPSVVAYLPNGTVSVGAPARLRAGIDPKNTLHSTKRILGLPWRASAVQTFRKTYRYDLEERADGGVNFLTRAGPRTAGEVSRDILGHVRSYPALGSAPFRSAMVTVPSHFEPGQRRTLAEAAAAAGFGKVGVIDEPYAAALAYLTAEAKERIVAVYDLGGGTFDFAVLRFHGYAHWVLATVGDEYLGGNDLDSRVATWIGEQVLSQHHCDLMSDPSVFQRLLLEAEAAKISLSTASQLEIELGRIDPALAGRTLLLTRPKLEQLTFDLVRRTFQTCDEALHQAGLSVQQVDAVVLVGGSTRMPIVTTTLEHYFGRPPLKSVPPDRVVAIGAAIAAALISGELPVNKPT